MNNADDKAGACSMLRLACIAAVGASTIGIMVPALPDAALHFGVDVGANQWAMSLPMWIVTGSMLVIGPFAEWLGRCPQ